MLNSKTPHTAIILALSLLSISNAATRDRSAATPTSFKSSSACAKYCENCYYDPYKRLYICSECLRRKFINSQKCSSVLAPASDNCLIYLGYNNGQCGICQPGYLYQGLIGTARNWACLRAKTPNCLTGTIAVSGNNAHTASDESCIVCKGSYPSEDLKTCNGGSLRDPYCLRGYRNIKHGDSGCDRCVPGYTVDYSTGRCRRVTLPGCRITEGSTRCRACDAENGYYWVNTLKCARD